MFPNAGRTTGSIGAILTGKLPTVTKVIYPPDIFMGKHSVQHLPGLLRRLGYTTGTICLKYYVNPVERGMVGAFDYVNGWLNFGLVDRLFSIYYGLWPNDAFFLKRTLKRHYEKLAPLWGGCNEVNPFKQVTTVAGPINDPKRIKQACQFMEQAPKPFFLELHLLGTHGPKFHPLIRRYSQEKDQSQPWMTDFYDDSIITFDMFVRELVDHLKKNGLYRNTIIVISSDHGMKWNAHCRLPLLIKFPKANTRGALSRQYSTLTLRRLY